MIARTYTLAAGALCLLASTGAPASGQTVIYTIDAGKVEGQMLSCSRDGELTTRTSKRTVRTLLERVSEIRLRAAPPAQEQPDAQEKPPHLLLLQDGTRLLGQVRSIGGTSLVWQRARRSRSVPLQAVRAIGLHADRQLGSVLLVSRPLVVRGQDEPRPFKTLTLAAGILRIDGAAAGLKQLRAIHYPPRSPERRASAGWYARVMLDGTQRINGLIERIDATQVVLVTRYLGRLTVPRSAIWRIIFGPAPTPGALGYTLIAASRDKQVVLLDQTGRLLWSLKALEKPHDVEPLADGSLLLVEYQSGRVRRIRRSGQAVWELKGLRNPIDADGLPGGGTLVTEFSAGRIVEYDVQRKPVWTWDGLKHPNEADPVGGDRVLITESGRNRVFLANRRSRKILWTYARLNWPMDADLLPGGNVLITDNKAHRVIEVSAAGQIIWEYRCRNPYEADKLANGNYLIVETGRNRVIEVTPDKRILWSAEGIDYPVAATRY